MPSNNVIAAMAWLRTHGFVATPHVTQPRATERVKRSRKSMQETTFTLDEQTAISRAFDSGTYANAYESTDLDAFEDDMADMSAHERAAFVLGFFGSYELHEMGSDEREIYDESYWSPAGRYVVKVAKYTDDRAEEYAAESEI